MAMTTGSVLAREALEELPMENLMSMATTMMNPVIVMPLLLVLLSFIGRYHLGLPMPDLTEP